MVAHACNPSYCEAQAGELLESEGRGCGEQRLRRYTPAWITSKALSQKKKTIQELAGCGGMWL